MRKGQHLVTYLLTHTLLCGWAKRLVWNCFSDWQRVLFHRGGLVTFYGQSPQIFLFGFQGGSGRELLTGTSSCKRSRQPKRPERQQCPGGLSMQGYWPTVMCLFWPPWAKHIHSNCLGKSMPSYGVHETVKENKDRVRCTQPWQRYACVVVPNGKAIIKPSFPMRKLPLRPPLLHAHTDSYFVQCIAIFSPHQRSGCFRTEIYN